ncbi:flagellar basal-body MS-ring/collar protein FliF [Crassaminicella profunda]|uniref:flagellar basal-body MS-ring/collar protein FliF n=1 Tax=Crassaminicella profunda TaxID=1286698 RepID=UPI001CA69400|nr:flagellar basal-body MS-ring/collar protein FliF [Crassaminicella profunda]QZY56746.1 flagellar M-ring protein FliF [Crassaminicella profunda]
MGNGLEHVKEQLNEFYKKLDKKQKIKIGVSGLLVIISMTLLFYFTSQPEYVTLFSDLTPKDVGEITAKLDEMTIPWKDNESNTTILVPKEYKNKAQAKLAVEGLPKESFSYEKMIDSSSLTMTNEERKKRYVIAQMNALAATIEEIDGIKNAMVNLSVADDTNFLLDKQKSKASVFVEIEQGKELSKEQVNGIAMLVANAVKDLDPENISIVDNRGQVLNKQKDDDTFDASTQLGLQKKVQSQIQESIKEFLSTSYGPGNVAVMVNVKLDFDSEVTDVKEFAPPIKDETNGLIRSMNEQNEHLTNGSDGGVPGTDSNSEDITQYVEDSGNGSKYDKANKTINYELNEINKKIVKAQGQVKDITVAVLINKQILPNGELTDEEEKKIKSIVSASAGLDTKVVEVMAKDFDTTIADEFASIEENSQSGTFGNIPLWAIGILGALLIGACVYTVYRLRKRKAAMDIVLDEPVSTIEDELDEIQLEVNEKSSYKKQIDKFVDKNPEAVAQLLKTWLNED